MAIPYYSPTFAYPGYPPLRPPTKRNVTLRTWYELWSNVQSPRLTSLAQDDFQVESPRPLLRVVNVEGMLVRVQVDQNSNRMKLHLSNGYSLDFDTQRDAYFDLVGWEDDVPTVKTAPPKKVIPEVCPKCGDIVYVARRSPHRRRGPRAEGDGDAEEEESSVRTTKEKEAVLRSCWMRGRVARRHIRILRCLWYGNESPIEGCPIL